MDETEAEGDRREKTVTVKDRKCPSGGQDHLMSTIDGIIRTAAG